LFGSKLSTSGAALSRNPGNGGPNSLAHRYRMMALATVSGQERSYIKNAAGVGRTARRARRPQP
jgi:hypothetical protein